MIDDINELLKDGEYTVTSIKFDEVEGIKRKPLLFPYSFDYVKNLAENTCIDYSWGRFFMKKTIIETFKAVREGEKWKVFEKANVDEESNFGNCCDWCFDKRIKGPLKKLGIDAEGYVTRYMENFRALLKTGGV